MNKDNYKEETPKKQVECLLSNATLRIYEKKFFIRGNPVSIIEKRICVMFISIIKFVSRICEGASAKTSQKLVLKSKQNFLFSFIVSSKLGVTGNASLRKISIYYFLHKLRKNFYHEMCAL